MMADIQEYSEGSLTMFVGSPEKIYTFASVAHASPLEQWRSGAASGWEKRARAQEWRETGTHVVCAGDGRDLEMQAGWFYLIFNTIHTIVAIFLIIYYNILVDI